VAPPVIPRSAAELEALTRGPGTPAERRQRLAQLQSKHSAAEAELRLAPPSGEVVAVWELMLGRAGTFPLLASRPTATAWAAATAAHAVGSYVPLRVPYGPRAVVQWLPAFMGNAKPRHVGVNYPPLRPAR
jgi:hypothetical protein